MSAKRIEIVVTENNGLFWAGFYVVGDDAGYTPRSGESKEEALQNLTDGIKKKIAVYQEVLSKLKCGEAGQ
jgi:hypothetical protein